LEKKSKLCILPKMMFIWLLSLFFLSHPLNFLTTADQGESESVEEEEEEDEDVSFIPAIDRKAEILTDS